MSDPYEAPRPAIEGANELVAGLGWPARLLSVVAVLGALGLLALASLIWASARGMTDFTVQLAMPLALTGAFLVAGAWQLHRMARAARAARRGAPDAVTEALLAHRALVVLGALYLPALVGEAGLYAVFSRWVG